MKHLIRQHLRTTVEVTLKTGHSFSAVLYDADSECFLLRNTVARGVGPKGEDVPADGEVLILRSDVAFMQVP